MSACGVPTGGGTRTIDAQSVPYGLLKDRQPSSGATGSSAGPGQTRRQIALVTDEAGVRLVRRDIAQGSTAITAGLLLHQLQAGPTDAERQRGLESAVSAGTDLRVVGWRRGVLYVDVSGEPNPAPDRLPLAIAQIVLTAGSVPGVRAVLFEHDGTPVQVPLLDGSLTSAALNSQEYQRLVDPGLAPSASGSSS